MDLEERLEPGDIEDIGHFGLRREQLDVFLHPVVAIPVNGME